MIDKISKTFTYAGKVNYISRRRFLSYLQKCEKTRKLATSYWTQYAREWGGECVWLRIIGLWETSRYLSQRTGNSLTCNPRHTFSFHARSRLTIHWLTGSLWAGSPFGRVARSHSRAAREIWRELRRSLSCSLVACFARHLKWRACSQANLWGFLKTS